MIVINRIVWEIINTHILKQDGSCFHTSNPIDYKTYGRMTIE